MTTEQLTRLVKQLEREIEQLKAVSVRAEIAGAVERKTAAALPSTFSAGRLWYVSDWLGGAVVYDNGAEIRPLISLASYLVANLPSNLPIRTLAWASDGLNVNEVTGGGTGVLVIWSGTTWRSVQTGLTVAS